MGGRARLQVRGPLPDSPGHLLARPSRAGARGRRVGDALAGNWALGPGGRGHGVPLASLDLNGDPQPPKCRPGRGRSRRGSGARGAVRGTRGRSGRFHRACPRPPMGRGPVRGGRLRVPATGLVPARARRPVPGTGAMDRPGVPVWGLYPPGLDRPWRSVPHCPWPEVSRAIPDRDPAGRWPSRGPGPFGRFHWLPWPSTGCLAGRRSPVGHGDGGPGQVAMAAGVDGPPFPAGRTKALPSSRPSRPRGPGSPRPWSLGDRRSPGREAFRPTPSPGRAGRLGP